MSRRHGRAELFQVSRSQLLEQLMHCEASTSAAGGELHLEIAHELIESLLMLGFAEAGQVRVDDGRDWAFVPEVDLDLAQVLALLKQVRGVGMAQGMNVRGFLHATGFEGQTKGALHRGAGDGFSGSGCALAAVAFGGKDECRVTVRLPLLTQEMKGAFGQWDVTVLVALAAADVQEHAFGIDVAHLQSKTFAQSQTTGVNGGETNAMIQRGDLLQHAAHFSGRKDHWQFELWIGAGQFDFVGPGALECFLPEDFDRADGLRAGLACDFLFGLKVNAILANLLRRDQVGGFAAELAELTHAVPVRLHRARQNGQER